VKRKKKKEKTIKIKNERKGNKKWNTKNTTPYLSIWKYSLSTPLDICQVHKHSGNSLTTKPQVDGVTKIVKMGIIFLTDFVAQNLNRFSILCSRNREPVKGIFMHCIRNEN
jgi:hypothetical protein